MNKWLYELLYRFPFVPIDWIFGSTSAIENLVDLGLNRGIVPRRAITLGCGVGRETIYLAQKGFDVTGVDFSTTTINRAKRDAQSKGVKVKFIQDDLTQLQHINGTFDLITDFGALNDLNHADRDSYMQNLLPLTHFDSRYLMFCFDKKLPIEEVKQRFGKDFTIEVLNNNPISQFPEGICLYLMTKK